jgi:hypothetical protein
MAANDESHAAWQEEAYAVYEVLGETRVLIGRERTFLDAVDLAARYLEAEDPPALEIVNGKETVFQYSQEDAAPPFDPIAHWGFDALRWRGPPRAGDGGAGRPRAS